MAGTGRALRDGLTSADLRIAILADPYAFGFVLAARAGCSRRTVDKLRRKMRAAGEIADKPVAEAAVKMDRRLTAEAADQAHAMRAAGMTFLNIGRALGFGPTCIQNHLAGRRSSPPKARTFSMDDLTLAIGLREQSKTNAQIGVILGYHENTIQAHLGTTPQMPAPVADPARIQPLCNWALSLMDKGISEADARYQAGRERERRAYARSRA